MNPKGRDHRVYIDVLRRMSPEKRLLRAFELSEFVDELSMHGLRKRFPYLSEHELDVLLRERLDKCRNRNY